MTINADPGSNKERIVEFDQPRTNWAVMVASDVPVTVFLNSSVVPTATISVKPGSPEIVYLDDCIARPANNGVEREFDLTSIYITNTTKKPAHVKISVRGSYMCPVCGYPEMDGAPASWNICPCCGVEFEYHDAGRTHEELRAEWIATGMNWWSTARLAPEGWNPETQLQRAFGDEKP
jgi:ribosomal protein L37AE/L43A